MAAHGGDASRGPGAQVAHQHGEFDEPSDEARRRGPAVALEQGGDQRCAGLPRQRAGLGRHAAPARKPRVLGVRFQVFDHRPAQVLQGGVRHQRHVASPEAGHFVSHPAQQAGRERRAGFDPVIERGEVRRCQPVFRERSVHVLAQHVVGDRQQRVERGAVVDDRTARMADGSDGGHLGLFAHGLGPVDQEPPHAFLQRLERHDEGLAFLFARRDLQAVRGGDRGGGRGALRALADAEEQRNESLHVRGWTAAHEARRQARARRGEGHLVYPVVAAGEPHGDFALGVHSVRSPRRNRPRRKSRLLIGAVACSLICAIGPGGSPATTSAFGTSGSGRVGRVEQGRARQFGHLTGGRVIGQFEHRRDQRAHLVLADRVVARRNELVFPGREGIAQLPALRQRGPGRHVARQQHQVDAPGRHHRAEPMRLPRRERDGLDVDRRVHEVEPFHPPGDRAIRRVQPRRRVGQQRLRAGRGVEDCWRSQSSLMTRKPSLVVEQLGQVQ